MNPEQLADKIKLACPNDLKSIVLYGSAAAGDHTGKGSDYNVLVVLERITVVELDALTPITAEWARAGNRAPLLFTREGLKKSEDSFAIELADIKDAHRILYGEDVLADTAVHRDQLRPQLERELRTRLMQLRERYLLSRGKPQAVMELMVRSLSTFLVLFRAALRLYQADVPRAKMDALDSLTRYISFDKQPFVTLHGMKKGEKPTKEMDVKGLFARYVESIESVSRRVDAFSKKE